MNLVGNAHTAPLRGDFTPVRADKLYKSRKMRKPLLDRLLDYLDVCLRDASLAELSATGRFNASRDAAGACAVILLRGDDTMFVDMRTEDILITLSAQRGIVDRQLASDLRQVAFDSADHTRGLLIADEVAAARAHDCAVRMYSLTEAMLRNDYRRNEIQNPSHE